MLGLGGLSASIGAAIANGHALPATVACVLAVALIAGLLNWRRSVYALLAYLPVSGVLTIALYPQTAPGVLAKDFLFVIPAYLGFLAENLSRRQPVTVPGAPVGLLAAVALIVAAQTFNPALPNVLVGVIGLKVWLFYIPLLFVGYHFIRDVRDLERTLLVMTSLAMVPAIIGIAEAIFIYGGQATFVYSLYGAAAGAVTQDFAVVTVGASEVRRVPSTFAFAAQYYVFCSAMVAVTYGYWRGFLVQRGRSLLGAALFSTVLMAAFLSGARGAILLIPFLVLLTVLLDRGRQGVSRFFWLGLSVFGGLFVAGIVLRTSIQPFVSDIVDHGIHEFQFNLVTGMVNALGTTAIGLGTGIDTLAGRYALPASEQFQAIGGNWYESLWVKTMLELGLLGLVLVTILLVTILVRGVRVHTSLTSARLRPLSAALVAFLVWNLVSSLKGQYLDFDPLNVYFWLFLGILFKLPVLDGEESDAQEPVLPPDPTETRRERAGQTPGLAAPASV